MLQFQIFQGFSVSSCPDPRGAGLDWGALLVPCSAPENSTFLWDFSKLLHRAVPHSHLREGKKNKRAAKWQCRAKIPRFFTQVFCLSMEKLEFSPAARLVLLETLKWYKINWLIRKKTQTPPSPKASQFVKFGQLTFGKERKELGNYFFMTLWAWTSVVCNSLVLHFLPKPVILCRAPVQLQVCELSPSCWRSQHFTAENNREKGIKSLISDHSTKALQQMIYLALDFPKDPGDWVPDFPKALSGFCFSFNNPT